MRSPLFVLRALEETVRFVLDENASLFDNFEPIRTGWNAAAVLWNGTGNVGWLAADNRVRTKSGDERVCDFIASPLGPLPDGWHMVSSMAVDIPARKQVEEALQRANEQLQQANQEVQQSAYYAARL